MVRIVDLGVVWHARIVAPEDGRPARKIVTGRRRRVTGFVPSRKAASPGLVPWESELERDCVVLAEFRPSVRAIVAQPHTLEAWSDAESFEHTPDYLLRAGQAGEDDEVVEVKPGVRALQPETERRLRISAAAHRALGFSFSVLGEAETGRSRGSPTSRSCCVTAWRLPMRDSRTASPRCSQAPTAG